MDAYPWIRTPRSPWITMDHMGRHLTCAGRETGCVPVDTHPPVPMDHNGPHGAPQPSLGMAGEWMRTLGYAPPSPHGSQWTTWGAISSAAFYVQLDGFLLHHLLLRSRHCHPT